MRKMLVCIISTPRGRETCFLTLSHEAKFRVSNNKVWRTIFSGFQDNCYKNKIKNYTSCTIDLTFFKPWGFAKTYMGGKICLYSEGLHEVVDNKCLELCIWRVGGWRDEVADRARRRKINCRHKIIMTYYRISVTIK